MQCLKQLNRKIDDSLPSFLSNFEYRSVQTNGKTFGEYARNPLERIKGRSGFSQWADVLHTAPERHSEDESRTTRVYSDSCTGHWLAVMQVPRGTRRGSSCLFCSPALNARSGPQLEMSGGSEWRLGTWKGTAGYPNFKR